MENIIIIIVCGLFLIFTLAFTCYVAFKTVMDSSSSVVYKPSEDDIDIEDAVPYLKLTNID